MIGVKKMAKRKLTEDEILNKEEKRINKENEKNKKVHYVLSEKTLSLSEQEFYKWLENSKASDASKRRYLNEYHRYQSIASIRNVDYSEKMQDEYNDKEKSLARKVAYAKLPIQLKITKVNYNQQIIILHEQFKRLMKYAYNANMIMLRCGFKVIDKKGKIQDWIYIYNDGVSSKAHRQNFFVVSSKTAKPSNFGEAWNGKDNRGVEPKLFRIVHSASIKGILTIFISIKFYYKRERKEK